MGQDKGFTSRVTIALVRRISKSVARVVSADLEVRPTIVAVALLSNFMRQDKGVAAREPNNYSDP